MWCVCKHVCVCERERERERERGGGGVRRKKQTIKKRESIKRKLKPRLEQLYQKN